MAGYLVRFLLKVGGGKVGTGLARVWSPGPGQPSGTWPGLALGQVKGAFAYAKQNL